jgi:hypothetical protein
MASISLADATSEKTPHVTFVVSHAFHSFGQVQMKTVCHPKKKKTGAAKAPRDQGAGRCARRASRKFFWSLFAPIN